MTVDAQPHQVCENCFGPLRTARQTKFCGAHCSTAWHSKKYRAKRRAGGASLNTGRSKRQTSPHRRSVIRSRPCLNCGQPVSQQGQRKFCCSQCRTEAGNRRRSQRHQTNKVLLTPEEIAERRGASLKAFVANARAAAKDIHSYLWRQKRQREARTVVRSCSKCGRPDAELTLVNGQAIRRCVICRRAQG